MTLSASSSIGVILQNARQQIATDIHLSTGASITLRVAGRLAKQSDESLTSDQISTHIKEITTEQQRQRLETSGDLECVYSHPDLGRFRVTVMKQRNGWDVTIRLITSVIPTMEHLNMPKAAEGLTKWAQGLVLVTGPAGCGKTTTLATLVNMINASRDDHIITMEEPIEIIYPTKRCQITQREIGVHSQSQANALRAALREDPDILVISELRDIDTIQLAITAAETGHLVFGTMNTNNATQTLSKLIDSFPTDQQDTIRNMVSESLRGVISQQLIPNVAGSGLVPAFELLLVNQAVSNLIRENKIGQLTNIMATGRSAGMVLLDNSLQELVASGEISSAEAMKRAINPNSLQMMI